MRWLHLGSSVKTWPVFVRSLNFGPSSRIRIAIAIRAEASSFFAAFNLRIRGPTAEYKIVSTTGEKEKLFNIFITASRISYAKRMNDMEKIRASGGEEAAVPYITLTLRVFRADAWI